MRFLLLSLLNVADAVGVIACGSFADKIGTAGFTLVSAGSCKSAGTVDAACKGVTAANGGDGSLKYKWWDLTGTETAEDKTASCAFPKSPLKTTSPALESDNLWDVDGKANYETAANTVAASAADEMGSTAPTDIKKGFMVFAEGEEFTPAIYKAASVGVLGSDAVDDKAPTVLCSKATRKGLADLQTADNIPVAKIDTTKTGRCKGGVLDTTDGVAAQSLAHNAVGDTKKTCWNLAFNTNTAPAKCTALETCDRFTDGKSQCVTTTKLMSAYTKATTAVLHCTIHKGAGTNDKYRHLDEAFASQECTKDYYCNSNAIAGNADPVCIQHILGTSAKTAARTAGAAVSATDATLKWCVGVTVGAKQCTVKEVCNPHAATRADLCINKTDTTLGDRVMAFGAVGAVAPTTGDDKRPYCIGDNAAGSVCGAATVCNYAGGDQSGVAGGDVCLAHTSLLGDPAIANTSSWTAAAQRKVDGVALMYCLATDGTAYSSKVCATTEKCNPHASSPADVCIKGITVMNHGDIAPAAADPAADSVRACIGKTYWKLCASEDGDVKEVCNEGAGALTEVCISTADCVNPELPMEAFREAGVEAAEDQKWCFATDGAAKCGLDTLCNPSGVDGGTGSAAICADATKSVPHGEAATEELIHCYGNTGNAVLAAEDEDGWLCDQGKGEFIDPKAKMAPRSKNETPDDLGEDEKAVEVCFGKDKVEKCDVGVYCNSIGTETGCTAEGCTTKNICVTVESLIEEGEQWVEDGKSICINADATKGEDCTTDKMYCDQTEGVCSAEEIATTDEPSSGKEGEGNTSGCAAQSLAAAAVVAILSA